VYLNPERKVDDGAFRVHGISSEFLEDKSLFKDILADFLQFVGGAELIIHNAAFDMGFLNSELKHCKWKKKLEEYCDVLDTLVIARDKHPGQRNSLDALCKRYNVDNTNRNFHGALLDAELLALVYLALTGGQTSLFGETESEFTSEKKTVQEVKSLYLQDAVVIKASIEELASHQDFIAFLEKKSGIKL
jgi:DNA polymerase-3 subunit epsilon